MHLLDDRPVSVSIFYFPSAPMQGDVDNIIKPILDALVGVAYPNDRHVERVEVQKFGADDRLDIFQTHRGARGSLGC